MSKAPVLLCLLITSEGVSASRCVCQQKRVATAASLAQSASRLTGSTRSSCCSSPSPSPSYEPNTQLAPIGRGSDQSALCTPPLAPPRSCAVLRLLARPQRAQPLARAASLFHMNSARQRRRLRAAAGTAASMHKQTNNQTNKQKQSGKNQRVVSGARGRFPASFSRHSRSLSVRGRGCHAHLKVNVFLPPHARHSMRVLAPRFEACCTCRSSIDTLRRGAAARGPRASSPPHRTPSPRAHLWPTSFLFSFFFFVPTIFFHRSRRCSARARGCSS